MYQTPSIEVYNRSMSGIRKSSRKYQIEQIEQAFISPTIFKENIKDVQKFYENLEKSTFITVKSFMIKVLKKKNFSYKTYSSIKEEFIKVAYRYKNSLLDVNINSPCSSTQQAYSSGEQDQQDCLQQDWTRDLGIAIADGIEEYNSEDYFMLPKQIFGYMIC